MTNTEKLQALSTRLRNLQTEYTAAAEGQKYWVGQEIDRLENLYYKLSN
jgi:ribosome assembly protein YihI (activator of Der GTPase)